MNEQRFGVELRLHKVDEGRHNHCNSKELATHISTTMMNKQLASLLSVILCTASVTTHALNIPLDLACFRAAWNAQNAEIACSESKSSADNDGNSSCIWCSTNNDKEGICLSKIEAGMANGQFGLKCPSIMSASASGSSTNSNSIMSVGSGGDNDYNDRENIDMIMVPLDPTITLSFYCGSSSSSSPKGGVDDNIIDNIATTAAIEKQQVVPCDIANNPKEMKLLLTTIIEELFIMMNDKNNDLVDVITYEFTKDGRGIESVGIDFKSSLLTIPTTIPATITTNNDNNVVASTNNSVRRRRPSLSSSDDVFAISGNIHIRDDQSSWLSNNNNIISSKLFVVTLNEEEALIDKIYERITTIFTKDGNWAHRVVGLSTVALQLSGGIDHTLKSSTTTTAQGYRFSSRRALRGEYDENTDTYKQDNKQEKRQDANKITTNALTIGIQQTEQQRDLASSGNNNTLLIVGAVGATISILLLIGGLWYAKSSYDTSEALQHSQSNNVFEPGKNNPRSPTTESSPTKSSSSSFFNKKKSISSDAIQDIIPGPPPPQSNHVDDDDDESNADFMLAQAALNHSYNKDNHDEDGMSAAGDASHADTRTFGDDMSYAFTVEGESLAPLSRGRSGASTGTNEDAMIGAGGMSSFANEKGTFRWNEDGTKMLYTPNQTTSETNEQHGFVFDENKKKWVVKDQVIGGKGVSFKQHTTMDKSDGPVVGAAPFMTSILRSRSADSGTSGVTGMSEFTYDDVALDAGKRTRSVASAGDDSTFMGSTPPSPGTPTEQGVEVAALGVGDDHSEFVSNTNVERFMQGGGGGDDDSAFTDFSNTAAFNTNLSQPITPERVTSTLSANSGVSETATMATWMTGDPGRIMPKKQPVKQNKMQINEDASFDNDIPFGQPRTRSGLSGLAGKFGRKSSSNKKKVPFDDDDDQSEASEGSANSAQVLEDLDKLSRFMSGRKHTSKSQKATTVNQAKLSSSGGGGGGSRRMNKHSLYADRGV